MNALEASSRATGPLPTLTTDCRHRRRCDSSVGRPLPEARDLAFERPQRQLEQRRRSALIATSLLERCVNELRLMHSQERA